MAPLKGKKKCGGAATPSVKDCAHCGASEGSVLGTPVHNACERCQITYYCSVACQRVHWETGGHKENCRTPEERSVAASRERQDAAEDAGAAVAAAAAVDGHAAAEGDECAICLEPLGGGREVSTLSCAHNFHAACMDTMRKHGHAECPLCREPLPPGAERSFCEGMTALMRGNLQRAGALFRQAVASEPGHPSALNNLAVIALHNGRADEAEDYFRRNVAANPRHVESLTGLADLCYQSRRTEESERLSRRALAVSSEDPHALLCMGRILRDRGDDLRAALDFFRRAARADPRDDDNHFDLALLLLVSLPACTKAEAIEAEAALRCACGIAPSDGRASFILGALIISRKNEAQRAQGARLIETGASLLLASGKHHEMFNMANNCIKMLLGADESPAEALRGIDAAVMEQIESLLRRAAALSDDPDYRVNLVLCLAAQEKWVEREKLKRQFELSDQADIDARTKTNQAANAAQRGDKRRAERLLRAAVELNKYNPETLLTLSSFLVEHYSGSSNSAPPNMVKLAEAEELLRRSIAVDDQISEAHFKLGFALNQQAMDQSPEAEPFFLERVRAADESFGRALVLDPGNVMAYTFKGMNLAMLRHDWVGAALCFANVLRLQPGHPSAQGHLDRCLSSMSPQQRTAYANAEQQRQVQRKSCANCGAVNASNRRCGRCRNTGMEVFYCGVDCQRAHWPTHRPQCRPRPRANTNTNTNTNTPAPP